MANELFLTTTSTQGLRALSGEVVALMLYKKSFIYQTVRIGRHN